MFSRWAWVNGRLSQSVMLGWTAVYCLRLLSLLGLGFGIWELHPSFLPSFLNLEAFLPKLIINMIHIVLHQLNYSVMPIRPSNTQDFPFLH